MDNKLKMDKKQNYEYVLAFGFRRFSACKALGWKTIPCLNKETNKIEEIKMDKIFVLDNTRLETNKDQLAELMQSIKDNGLLQPIGVWRKDSLKAEDFIAINLTENIHRENISNYELGQAINRLLELGMNRKQIAVRLSISPSRVNALCDISRTIGNQLVSECTSTGMKNDGKIKLSTLNIVMNMRISGDAKKELIDWAKNHADLGVNKVRLICEFIQKGLTVEQAVKESESYHRALVTLVLDKEVMKEMQEEYKIATTSKLIEKILKGKIKTEPRLICSITK